MLTLNWLLFISRPSSIWSLAVLVGGNKIGHKHCFSKILLLYWELFWNFQNFPELFWTFKNYSKLPETVENFSEGFSTVEHYWQLSCQIVMRVQLCMPVIINNIPLYPCARTISWDTFLRFQYQSVTTVALNYCNIIHTIKGYSHNSHNSCNKYDVKECTSVPRRPCCEASLLLSLKHNNLARSKV